MVSTILANLEGCQERVLAGRLPYSHQPWNKGKLVGQKAPLRVRDIWSIRVRLQLGERTRDLALFNLAIDSKLRACDLTKLRVRDIAHGEHVSSRAIVMQQKTQHPVQFEITEQTRTVLEAWMHQAHLRSEDFLFPTRLHGSDHLSTGLCRDKGKSGHSLCNIMILL